MAGLMGFFWLGVFLIAGFPAALGIEHYSRALRRNEAPEPDEALVPREIGMARRLLQRFRPAR